MGDVLPGGVREDVRHFHVHTCLGSGGFGDVYRATMISAGGVRHEVAIKVLHDGLDPSSQAVQRLRDEGRVLGVLRHPAILRVHDLVILAGRVALVTEFVEGGDLDQCFRAGDLELRPLVEIVGQVAAALDAAWNHPSPDGKGALHLVHRDVKPANIRIGRHGEVKLLDFGIAKAAGVQREAKTQARALIGSYLYMSPERLVRKDGVLPAGDIYALGAVLYEGLGRRRLFAGVDLKDQLELAKDRAAHDRYVSEAISALHAVDPRARELCQAALRHDEATRPSATELANRCEELADALPGPNLRQWARKRSWPGAADVLGELGGKTLTESTLVTDTLPADVLKTPAPVPRQQSTVAEFLDEVSVEPPRAGATLVAVEGAEAESLPPPIPVALEVPTQVRQQPKPPAPRPPGTPAASPRREAAFVPAPAPSRSPPASAGRGWMVGVAVVVLVLVIVPVIAVVSGAGTLLLFQLGASRPTEVTTVPEAAVVATPVAHPEVAPAPVATGSGTGAAVAAAPPQPAPAPAPVGSVEPEVIVVVAPTTAPEAVPAPAPVVVITREPEPGSDAGWGDPEGAAAPAPAPVQPRTGTVVIDGRVPVELRGRGEVHHPGQVPIGSWEVWADFGTGMTRASTSLLNVTAGGSYTVKCSALRLQCSSVGG